MESRTLGARIRVSVIPVLVLLLAAGCTPDHRESERQATAAGNVHEPVQNPLVAITDPESTDYVASQVSPILDEQGTGATEFTLPQVDNAAGVSFYVACSPESEYKVTAFNNFFSGGCGPRFKNNGEIPVGDSMPIESAVSLELPEGVDFHIIALAVDRK